MNEWFEDEQFRIDTFPFMFPQERLERTGFSEVRLYGDLDGSEYGTDAKRLVVLARKGY